MSSDRANASSTDERTTLSDRDSVFQAEPRRARSGGRRHGARSLGDPDPGVRRSLSEDRQRNVDRTRPAMETVRRTELA